MTVDYVSWEPLDDADIVELRPKMPEVRYIAFTTGAWDLLAEASAGSTRHGPAAP